MGKKVKKITNGGFYWVNFDGFRLPEWGNNKGGTLHISILIKVSNFNGNEMYLSIPLTSNEFYYNQLGENIVHKFNIDERIQYALIGQVRMVSKSRAIREFKTTIGDHMICTDELIHQLESKIKSYFEYNFNIAKLSIKSRGDNNG